MLVGNYLMCRKRHIAWLLGMTQPREFSRAGLGLTHHSQLPGNGDNDFFTQSATVWDAQISFVTKSAKFGAYVNNLTNKQYMRPSAYFGGGQLLPNAPRTFMLSAQFYL